MVVLQSQLVRETPRLILRPLQTGDEDSVFVLLSDERVVRYMLFPLFDRERAQRFVARMSQPVPDAGPDARQIVLGTTMRTDDELIGLCGLVVNPELDQAELWYLLRPDLWGRGFVTEAGSALVGLGFSELRLHRIWASCLPSNPASARVLEKLAFRQEGHLRQNLRIHGIWHDSFLYALLHSEWDSR